MTEPASDPSLEELREALCREGGTRTATVPGVEADEVLVELGAPVGPGLTLGSIARHRLSRKPFGHPSQVVRVGQRIEVEVVGVSGGSGGHARLQVSARACEDPDLRAFLLGVRRGEHRLGTVADVHAYGVFVHLDGEPAGRCTGFVRVPELTWRYIGHPSEAVEAGQRVTGEVLDSDTDRGQVSLSLKALEEDPLNRLAGRVGEVVTGTVTKTAPIGVLVRVPGGVLGLVRGFEQPDGSPAVREGDRMTVRIAEVDRERRRVVLSPAGGDGPGPRP